MIVVIYFFFLLGSVWSYGGYGGLEYVFSNVCGRYCEVFWDGFWGRYSCI